MALAAATESSTVVLPIQEQCRLPSNRPIDRRWDRSRGIVFHHTTRPSSRDYTWKPKDGIAFAPFCSTARTYKRRELGIGGARTPSPSSPSTAATSSASYENGDSSSMLERAHASGGFGSSNAAAINELRAQKAAVEQALEKAKADRDANIKKLEGSISELKDEARLEQQKQSSLQDQIAELQEKLENEKKEATMIRNEYDKKEAAIREELRAEQTRVDREINEAQMKFDRELDKVRRESDPERKSNEAVLAEVHQEAYKVAQKEMYQREQELRHNLRQREQDLHDKMQSRENALQRVIDASHTEIESFRLQLAANNEELEQLRVQQERAGDAEKKYSDLADKINRQRQRSKEERGSYAAYRALWHDLRNTLYPLLFSLRDLSRDASKKARLWRECGEKYRSSRALLIPRQAGKFPAVDKAITDFLETKFTESQQEAEKFGNLGDQLLAENATVSTNAHFSRTLTRQLHFGDAETVYTTADLAEQIANVRPFRQRRMEARDIAEKLENKIRQGDASSPEIQDLRTLLRKQHDATDFWGFLVDMTEAMRRYHALDALRNASLVEKRVHMKTHGFHERLLRAEDDELEVSDGSGDEGNKLSGWDQDPELRKSQRLALDGLHAYTKLVREQGLLQQDIDMADEEETQRYNSAIDAQMARHKRVLDQYAERLVPIVAAKQRRRREITRSIASTAPGPPTMRNKFGRDPVIRTHRPAVESPIARLSSSERKRRVPIWREEVVSKEKAKAKLLAASKAKDAKDGNDSKIKKLEKEILHLNAKIAAAEDQARKSDSSTEAQPPNEMTKSDKPETKAKRRSHRGLPGRVSIRRHRSGPPLANRSGSLADLQKSLNERTTGGLGLKPTEPRRAIHPSSAFHALCCPDNISRITHVGRAQISPLFALLNTDRNSALPFAPSTMSPEGPTGEREGAGAATDLTRPLQSLSLSDEHATPGAHPSEKQLASVSEDQSVSQADAASTVHTSDAGDDQSNELEYHIPAKDYRAAVMASPNSNAAFWSHTLYKGSEGKKPVVYYCTDLLKAEERAKLFADEPVLGFDLEWEMGASLNKEPMDIKNNLSLIQIACQDKIGLFQIALFKGTSVEELLPPTLRRILESPSIIKAGVNIGGDAKRVKACMGVGMQGVFELSYLYTLVNYSVQSPEKVNFKLVSLASQVQNVLLLPLKKDSTRTSAWSHRLNSQQTDYAASDAYAGFQLYHKLEKQRKAIVPTPQRPAFSELDLPMVLANGVKVYKGQNRGSRKTVRREKTQPGAEAAVEASENGEEKEEFFDAAEELDDLDTRDPASAPEGTRLPAEQVLYPDLAALDLPSDSEVAASLESRDELDQRPPEDEADFEASREPVDSTSTSSKILHPDSDETRLADAWVATWRASLPPEYNVVGRPRELRAWHLWHEQGHSMEEVAALLKDPPLVRTTVASYILQSIRAENLPYDEGRVKEVLNVLPKVARARYWKVVKELEEA